LQSIPVWENVSKEQFHNEIVPLNKPAVIKSLMADWSIVKAAKKSPIDFAKYIKSRDNKTQVAALVGSPDCDGRLFYNKDFNGFNFTRKPVTLGAAITHLINTSKKTNSPVIAIQAIPVREFLPDFDQENAQPFLDKSVVPTMWMNNRNLVAPHYDPHDNIAAVVAGRRKFTLFPPDQIKNLYLGPMLNTPAGVPISLVNILEPDFEKFPNYREALDKGQEAFLDPGDAIYIPALWWHAVQSLENINALVNYWWSGISNNGLMPINSLLHSMLSISELSSDKRKAWRDYFDYLVFKLHDEPSDHLPKDLDDITTKLSAKQEKALRDFLSATLQKRS
jgi:hypothetical protein